MVQRGCRLRFALKTAASSSVGQVVGQELDGDRPIQLRVERAVDDAHAAGADWRHELVVPDALGGAIASEAAATMRLGAHGPCRSSAAESFAAINDSTSRRRLSSPRRPGRRTHPARADRAPARRGRPAKPAASAPRHRPCAPQLAPQPCSARLQSSWITGRGETSSTAAVSATLSPPKNRSLTTRLFRSFSFASACSASSSATRSWLFFQSASQDRRSKPGADCHLVSDSDAPAQCPRGSGASAGRTSRESAPGSASSRAGRRPTGDTPRSPALSLAGCDARRHTAPRDPPQLLMDKRCQPGKRRLVARLPCQKERGHGA